MNDIKWIRWFAVGSASILLVACVGLQFKPNSAIPAAFGLFLMTLPTLIALFLAIFGRLWLVFIVGLWMAVVAVVSLNCLTGNRSAAPCLITFIAAVSLSATPFFRMAVRVPPAKTASIPTANAGLPVPPIPRTPNAQSAEDTSPLFIQPTWDHVIQIWWSFIWRSILFNFALIMILTMALVAIVTPFGIKPNLEVVTFISGSLGSAIGTLIIMKAVLQKKFPQFSIKLVHS